MITSPLDRIIVEQTVLQVGKVVNLAAIAMYRIEVVAEPRIIETLLLPGEEDHWSPAQYFQRWEKSFLEAIKDNQDAYVPRHKLDESYRNVACVFGARGLFPCTGWGFIAYVKCAAESDEVHKYEALYRLGQIKVELMQDAFEAVKSMAG